MAARTEVDSAMLEEFMESQPARLALPTHLNGLKNDLNRICDSSP